MEQLSDINTAMLNWTQLAIILLALYSFKADYIDYFHNEYVENESYKHVEIRYDNDYSKFIKFTYNLRVENSEHYDQSYITLFVAAVSDQCLNYIIYLESESQESLNVIVNLQKNKEVYLETSLSHSVPMDKFLRRGGETQFLCFVYHTPHYPRKFSNKIRHFFVKHSFEMKYDIKILYFHFLFVLSLFSFVLITYYIKWTLRKDQKIEHIIHKVKEKHK